MRCFGDPKDTIDSKQLKNQIYLLRFGHTRALLFKKKGHEMAISPVLGKLTHMGRPEMNMRADQPQMGRPRGDHAVSSRQ